MLQTCRQKEPPEDNKELLEIKRMMVHIKSQVEKRQGAEDVSPQSKTKHCKYQKKMNTGALGKHPKQPKIQKPNFQRKR